MRTIIISAILMLATASGLMAGVDPIDMGQISNVSTGGTTAVTTNTSVAQDGYVENVYVDLSGYASPTVNVSVVTSGALPSRTILAVTSVTADTLYTVRAPIVNTAGSAISNQGDKIPLAQDAIKAWASSANSTGVNVRVYLIKSHLP